MNINRHHGTKPSDSNQLFLSYIHDANYTFRTKFADYLGNLSGKKTGRKGFHLFAGIENISPLSFSSLFFSLKHENIENFINRSSNTFETFKYYLIF